MTKRTGSGLHRLLRTGPAVWITIACVEVIVAVVVLSLIPPPIDMQVYRLGAQALLNGHTLYTDLPPTIGGVGLPFIYPPIAAVLLTPLTLMSVFTAQIVFNLVSIVAVGITLYAVFIVLYRHGRFRGQDYSPPALAVKLTLLVLPLAMLLEPVRETELFGQINSVLMVLTAVDCLLLRHTRYRGLLTGLAAAVKLTPAAFVLFFLLRKDWRGVLGVVVGGVVATGIGYVCAPGDSVTFLTVKLLGGNMIGSPAYATNQTLKGLWARLITTDPTLQNIVWIVSVVALVVVMVIGMRRAFAANSPIGAYSIDAIGGLLISPAAWSHHWVYVAPALLLLAITCRHLRRAWLTAGTVFLVVMFYVGPMWYVPRDNGAELHWNAWQQFYGNAYVLFSVLALVVAAFAIRVRQAPPTREAVGVPAGRGA